MSMSDWFDARVPWAGPDNFKTGVTGIPQKTTSFPTTPVGSPPLTTRTPILPARVTKLYGHGELENSSISVWKRRIAWLAANRLAAMRSLT